MEASALSASARLSRGSGTSPWLRLRSDEQLVGLFRSGNEEAFRVIHDRYRQRLYAYARQMLGGAGSDAEDVMQDVFLRAYRALRADERPVSLRAWLYRVAHNRCIDGLRRPTPPASEIFEMSRTPIHDTMVEAERREDLQRLVADVGRLPDQQRSALLMREMDGMSYADLAAALETSVPAVKSLLVRARIGLVEAIEARDTDCADIRHDLAASYDRGVRASGRARRHLRDCDGCTTYRAQLRGVRQGFAALSPDAVSGGLLAKLLGLGSAGAGSGAAAAGSGTTVAIGGGVATGAITKVAVIVCCAAVVTGGAVEVQRVVAPNPQVHNAQGRHVTNALPSTLVVELHGHAAPGLDRPAGGHIKDIALAPPTALQPALGAHDAGKNGSGGALAPPEEPVADTPADTPADTVEPTPAGDTVTDGDTPIGLLPGEDVTGTPPATGSPASGTSSSQTSSESSSSSSTGTQGSGTSGSSTGNGESSATAASTSGSSSSSGSGTTSGSSGSSGGGSSGTSATPAHPAV